jgi:hypothetical protein
MKGKFKRGLHCFHNRKIWVFVSLLFIITLFSSCLVSVFSVISPFVLSASDRVVKNEIELRNAINNAPSKTSIIITLDTDISLSSALVISANKDITLTGNKVIGYYKLIGVDGESTISVDGGGMLKLDGIVITHEKDKAGSGVTVDSGGTLILYSGEISGNTVYGRGMPALVGGYSSYGGGVYNSGAFEMYGGKISGNFASVGKGGGVYNSGTFKLSGGEISNNTADTAVFTESEYTGHGGGVYNSGTFAMSDGKITRNTASGGGVYNYGTFELMGGEISGNTGSGVYQRWGMFTMSGGEIRGNTAYMGGGVYVYLSSTFDRQGGLISGNTVTNKDGEGKDVYIYSSDGSSGGGGSSNGNNGSSGGNIGGGSSNGNSGLSTGSGGYSLRDIVIICVGVVGLTAVVITISLFVYFSKRMKRVEEKLNTSGN